MSITSPVHHPSCLVAAMPPCFKRNTLAWSERNYYQVHCIRIWQATFSVLRITFPRPRSCNRSGALFTYDVSVASSVKFGTLSVEIRIGKFRGVNIGRGTSCKPFMSTFCSSGSFVMLWFRSSVYLFTKIPSVLIRPVNVTPYGQYSPFQSYNFDVNFDVSMCPYWPLRSTRNYIPPHSFSQEKNGGSRTTVADGHKLSSGS